jgi:hypothetical protein
MSTYYRTHEWLVRAEIVEKATNKARAKYDHWHNSAIPLSNREKQQLTMLEIKLSVVACPACSMPVHQVAAAAAYRELYDACEATDRDFACPCCGMRLEMAVPILSMHPYHWILKLSDAQIDLLRDTIADTCDEEGGAA